MIKRFFYRRHRKTLSHLLSNGLRIILFNTKKTRQDAMLAEFPSAKLDKDGIIDTCPNFPLSHFGTERCEQYKRNCDVCRRDYWLEEVGPNGRS